jgi:transcriptional regulator with XRE-family HTH domain
MSRPPADQVEVASRIIIGRNIADLRREKEWSQAQLGTAMGRSKDYIQGIEYGRIKIGLVDAIALAQIFNIPESALSLLAQKGFSATVNGWTSMSGRSVTPSATPPRATIVRNISGRNFPDSPTGT